MEHSVYLSPSQIKSHIRAGEKILAIKEQTCKMLSASIRTGKPITEWQLQQYISTQCHNRGLICEEPDGPWVAAGSHTGNPFHTPSRDSKLLLTEGSCLLIDIWCREDQPDSIYHDLTFCLYLGDHPPAQYVRLFQVAATARDMVLKELTQRLYSAIPVTGAELDWLCRECIQTQGYGDYIRHRTGHSITTQAHGDGVNLDFLDSFAHRPLLPSTCFSIEPGIYLPQMGVRTEINVVIHPDRTLRIYAPLQRQVECIG